MDSSYLVHQANLNYRDRKSTHAGYLYGSVNKQVLLLQTVSGVKIITISFQKD
jgi:predicted alternative tryptophan synthase beta-subunit